MPPDSLVLNSKFVQGGTNAKPDNVMQQLKEALRFHKHFQLLYSNKEVH